MRVSLEWLREYVDVPVAPDELSSLFDRLQMSGLAIEAIHRTGEGVAGIVAARVIGHSPHPGAAGLSVVDLDAGCQGQFSVVCGASNFECGDIVPLAVPDSVLPGGKVIVSAAIRGIQSQGMMCSAAELGLAEGKEAEAGILILPPDVVPGTDCVGLLALTDTVIELDLTPNYAVFCQSMLGVAREVAALLGTAVREPALPEGMEALAGPLSASEQRHFTADPAGGLAAVRIEVPTLCSRYSGGLFTDVRIAPSPWWLQRRLRAAGVRPISNIVDVTNYVMLEFGQPLHAFDHGLVHGGLVAVRPSWADESLVTLDGVERLLPPGALVIADCDRAVALAGIMGGRDTEITAQTTTIFLESANFLRTSVRRTSRQMGLRTEASARFEKGSDPAITVAAIERASQLLVEIGAARRVPGLIDVVAEATGPRLIEASVSYLQTIIGVRLSAAHMAGLLCQLGIPAKVRGETADAVGAGLIAAVVPTRRLDIEGRADLAEEIARAYGYQHIPAELPFVPMASPMLPPRRQPLLQVRRVLLGLGLDELVTFAYHGSGDLDRLRLSADHPWRQAMPVLNPMNEEQARLRTSLVPNLLRTLAYNQAQGIEDCSGFEIGRVYLAGGLPVKELPAEPLRLGIIMAGTAPGAGNWRRRSEAADFFALKGVVEAVVAGARLPEAECVPGAPSFMHPGRTALLRFAGAGAGFLGELHPAVAGAYGLRGRVYLAELDIELLLDIAVPHGAFRGLPRYPAVQRDLAVEVPAAVAAASIERSLRDAGGEWLEALRLFDVYQGPQVPDGYRSLAYSFQLRAPERTLTDAEADEIARRMVAAVELLGGRLRA